jgi:hypothetical protein
MKTDVCSSSTQAGDGETSESVPLLWDCFGTLLEVPQGYVHEDLQDTEADFANLDAVSMCLFVSFLVLF